ncbi:fibronectin type III domain-containing protein [Spirillospora sp. CA-253888]
MSVIAAPGGKSVTVNDCDPRQPNCTATLTGLDPAADHTFTVVAQSADGKSPASSATAPIRPKLVTKNQPRNLSMPAANTLTEVRSNGTLVFSSPPPEVTDLTAGQILVVPATPAAPEGLLKKITQVTTTGVRTVITTSEATLADIITDGDFTGQLTLDRGDLASAPSSLAPVLPPKTGKRQAMQSFGDPLHFPLHQSIGSYGRFDADLVLTPTLTYHLKIRGNKLSGKVAVQTKLSGHLQVTAARQATWSKHFSLGKWKYARTVQVGWFRIPITATTALHVKAQADASGKVTFGASPDIATGVATQIEGTKTSWESYYHDRTTVDRPVLEGTANARFGLTSTTIVSVAGTIGVGAELTPYLQAQADLKVDPWWTIRAGATIRGCVAWLDACTPAAASKNFSTLLLSADGPFRGLQIEPNYARTARGRTVDFNAVAYNLPTPQVRWQVVSGPGSIDANGLYISNTAGIAVVRATANNTDLDDPDAEAEVDPNAPHAPTDVRATPAPLAAHVSWQPPADTLVGITGYTVVATPQQPGHPEVTGTASSSDRVFDLLGLDPDVTYDVRVYATNGYGAGPPSAVVTVKPNPGLTPAGGAVNAATDANGTPDNTGNSDNYVARISDDGRYVFFITTGNSNIMPAEAADSASSAYYLLRKDMETGELKLASRKADGRTPAPVDPIRFAVIGYEGARPGTSVAYATMPSAGTNDGDLIVNDIDGNSAWLVMDGNDESYLYYSISLSVDGDSISYGVRNETNKPIQGNHIRYAERGRGDLYMPINWNADFLYSRHSMDSEGGLIVYMRSVVVNDQNTVEMRSYETQTGSSKIILSYVPPADPHYRNVHDFKISGDGSTIFYRQASGEAGIPPAKLETFVKKITEAGFGTRVGPVGWEGIDMSEDGRFISGHPYDIHYDHGHDGIYDRFTGGFINTWGATFLAGDASAGVGANTSCNGSCPPGVWYQRFNFPKGNSGMQECNKPDYGSIGQYGRRTGARVKLCSPIPVGDHATTRKPPGFPRSVYKPTWKVPSSWPTENSAAGNGNWIFQRGHIIGRQLGGKKNFSNFVTQFEYSNNELQKVLEKKISEEVEAAGEEIYYYVIPVYSDLDAPQTPTITNAGGANWVGAFPSKEYPMPNKIHIIAQGTGNYYVDACIPNTQDRTLTVTYNDPCPA